VSTRKNIAANFVGKFWSILSNFLFVPLYIHILGFDSYSIISFTLVIAGLMAVLDAGLTATLSREMARSDTSLDEKISVYRTLESAYFILAAVVLLLILGASNLIADKWLNVDAFSNNEVSLFLRIISLDVAFQLLFRFYLGGLFGLEHQVQANVYQILWGVLRNGLVLVPIVFFPSLNTFFWWQACSTVVATLLIKAALDKRLMGRSCFGQPPVLKKEVFSRIWRFALGVLLITMVSSINTQLDKLAISKMLSIEVLGHYTLAISLGQGLVILVSPIAAALLPRLTALYSQKAYKEIDALYHTYGMLIAVLVSSVMSILFFFPEEILWVWTGKAALAGEASIYLPVVAFSMGMLALAIHPYNIAIANGYTRLNNIMGIVSLVLTIPGYWLAVRYHGALGAAFVFCIVQTMTLIVYVFLIHRRFMGKVSLFRIYGTEMLLPILVSMVVAFSCSFIPATIEGNRWLLLIWILGAAIVTFFLTSLVFLPVKKVTSLFHQND